jgi:hypothetical protein
VLHLHPPDCVNLAEDRIECPVCGGAGVLARVLDENVDLACENCDGKGTLIRPTGRQHLSHSSLGMQLACQRRYQHAYVDRLEPIRRKSSLSLGSAFAKAVELREPAGRRGHACSKPTSRWSRRTSTASSSTWPSSRARRRPTCRGTTSTALTFSTATSWPSSSAAGQERDRGRVPRAPALALHRGLLQHLRPLRPRRRRRRPRRLPGAHRGQAGRPDRRGVGQEDPRRPPAVPRRLRLWRITGKPVRKVRKRFTKKPQIRQRKGESVTEFCERIRADYRERPDFYMHEETTFRDADDMLDVERSLWDWAEQRRAAAAPWLLAHEHRPLPRLRRLRLPRHLLRRRAGPLPAQAGEGDDVLARCPIAPGSLLTDAAAHGRSMTPERRRPAALPGWIRRCDHAVRRYP